MTVARWTLLLCALLFAAPAFAQSADTILINGKIVTLEAAGTAEALAVADGRIVATGKSDDIRKLAGASTRSDRSRAGRTVYSRSDQLAHARDPRRAVLRDRGELDRHQVDPGSDGAHPRQGEEREARRVDDRGRRLDAAAVRGEAPADAGRTGRGRARASGLRPAVYYSALLTPAGFTALNITKDADVPPRGKIERNADGNPKGWIAGDNPTISGLFDRLPLPNFEQRVEGTKQFFRELNRLGLTAVSDPGEFNLTPENYQPLFQVWRDRELSVRVIYSLFAQRRGKELEDFQALTQLVPIGFGDDRLRFNGVGENVTWGMYNNDDPTDAQKEQYYQVARWAAERGMTLTQHWNNDKSVSHLLDVLERVNAEIPTRAALVDRAPQRRDAGEPCSA